MAAAWEAEAGEADPGEAAAAAPGAGGSGRCSASKRPRLPASRVTQRAASPKSARLI